MKLITALLGVTLSLLISGFALNVSAGDIDNQYKTANLKRGGQLYDNWIKASDQNPPDRNNPLYSGTGNISAEQTWYCSGCHGWEYESIPGTADSGIKEAAKQEASVIYGVIEGQGTTHDFSRFLSRRELLALTRFIKEGTYDFAAVITKEGKITGNKSIGEGTFLARCAPCHNKDGKRYDFDRDKSGVQGLGYLANAEPAKLFHKVLWGDPGTGMPSWIVDFEKKYEDVIDVLSYVQSLEK